MAQTYRARIAFVSGGAGGRSHFKSMAPIVPGDVQLEVETLGLYSGSLYDVEGKKAELVEGTRRLAVERGWDGVMVTAAPPEVLNPGLFDDLKAAVSVPVTTALNACVAALRAFSASNVLLLTPFDPRLNDLIREHLAAQGVTAIAPRPFDTINEAIKLTPDEVFEHARGALAEAGSVDAIYFQGAVLDPIEAIERVERELHTTVVASNPAMMWYILSRLGLRYPVGGYGRLLREWPAPGDQ
jgi:hypothetical protein